MYRGLKNGVQDVAVKVLGHSGPAQLQQFEHEIKLLKGISFDRNIIQVKGVDYSENRELEASSCRHCTGHRYGPWVRLTSTSSTLLAPDMLL